jgi:tRNA (guanine37-N1)-methyltransferase
MNFHVISLFPEMLADALKWGVVGRAREKGLFNVDFVDPRKFTSDVHKTVDDRPFGGGDGMVMLFEPLSKAIESIPNQQSKKKIYLSPTGRLLNESLVQELSGHGDFILLSGRYGGVDQRLLNHYEFEAVSVGDYVVSGGELPALILMDALLRKVSGVLGNSQSSAEDSFARYPHFEAPQFTRPSEIPAGKVPATLMSGDHKKIEEFRRLVGLGLTLQNRPGLVQISEDDKKKLAKFFAGITAEDLKTLGFTEDFLRRI